MKILVVQDHLRSGGTERQSVFLANAFSARGHETTLLTFRPGGALAGTVATSVRRIVLQPADLRLDWFAPGLLSQARSRQPDIVLCMGRMANCHAGRLQRALPHAAVIGTMRTGKPLPFLFRRSLRAVRHIIANSAEAGEGLATKYGVDPARISVIYNSLVFRSSGPSSADAPQSHRQTIRARNGADDSTTVLLCVAMLRPEKNQRGLIDIVADLPEAVNCQLWLAGDGPELATCVNVVAERQLGHRVKLLGFQRDPTPLYAAADIAVHASSSESLSNFLIEAQAHGLPVVAYEAQGIRECFVADQTGWAITRGDPPAFRERLLWLINTSPEDRLSRAEAARAYARRTFDSERQVAAYLDLFATLTRAR